MIIENPFIKCPSYETDNFIISKTKMEDATDLFEVYSDQTTKSHMNNDNCVRKWQCDSFEIVKEGIAGWIRAYEDKFNIRWTITQKSNMKHIGTIELAPPSNTTRFFDDTCSTGILRVDLKSEFETEKVFSEIYRMTNTEMIEAFGIEKIITKGNKDDYNRLKGLDNSLYKRIPNYEIIPYPNYYISYKW